MARDDDQWGPVESCVRWAAIMGLAVVIFVTMFAEAVLTGIAAAPVLAAAACNMITRWLMAEMEKVWIG